VPHREPGGQAGEHDRRHDQDRRAECPDVEIVAGIADDEPQRDHKRAGPARDRPGRDSRPEKGDAEAALRSYREAKSLNPRSGLFSQ
jgi:hypothetical protein